MRKSTIPTPLLLALACGAAAAFSGCQAQYVALSDEEVAEQRAKLVLAEEPAGAITVLDVHDLLAGSTEKPHDHTEHDHTEHDHTEQDHEHAEGDGHVHSHEAEVQNTSIEPQDVVVVGQIGGMPSPWGDTYPDYPWKEREAAFFLADPATVAELADHVHSHEEGHVHSHEDCPFCARAAAQNINSVAVVNFANAAGETLPVDARQLFGLEENATVVVRGRARILGGKLLVIEADGIYVRQ